MKRWPFFGKRRSRTSTSQKSFTSPQRSRKSFSSLRAHRSQVRHDKKQRESGDKTRSKKRKEPPPVHFATHHPRRHDSKGKGDLEYPEAFDLISRGQMHHSHVPGLEDINANLMKAQSTQSAVVLRVSGPRRTRESEHSRSAIRTSDEHRSVTSPSRTDHHPDGRQSETASFSLSDISVDCLSPKTPIRATTDSELLNKRKKRGYSRRTNGGVSKKARLPLEALAPNIDDSEPPDRISLPPVVHGDSPTRRRKTGRQSRDRPRSNAPMSNRSSGHAAPESNRSSGRAGSLVLSSSASPNSSSFSKSRTERGPEPRRDLEERTIQRQIKEPPRLDEFPRRLTSLIPEEWTRQVAQELDCDTDKKESSSSSPVKDRVIPVYPDPDDGSYGPIRDGPNKEVFAHPFRPPKLHPPSIYGRPTSPRNPTSGWRLPSVDLYGQKLPKTKVAKSPKAERANPFPFPDSKKKWTTSPPKTVPLPKLQRLGSWVLDCDNPRRHSHRKIRRRS